MGISRLSNGFYTWSDEHFKSMNKKDLINYIRTIEKNWENALITNAIQYDNCKRLLAEERNKAVDDALEVSAKAICVGCGYLDGYKCTYKGSNCGVSKPMLESVTKALEQMKAGDEE